MEFLSYHLRIVYHITMKSSLKNTMNKNACRKRENREKTLKYEYYFIKTKYIKFYAKNGCGFLLTNFFHTL